MYLGEIILHRFNGDEVRGITGGSLSIFKRNNDVLLNFWVHSDGNLLSKPLEDSYIENLITFEFLTKLEAEPKDLIGLSLKPPSWEDPEYSDADWGDTGSYYNHIYFGSHDQMDEIVFEVVEKVDNGYLINGSCVTTDVNIFENSMKVEIKAVLPLEEKLNGYWTYDKEAEANASE